MATNRRTSPLVSFFSENRLRLGIAGFILGSIAAVVVVVFTSFIQTFISYRFAARTYSSADYHLLLDEVERMYFLDTYAAFDLIEAETEMNPNKVDQLEGLVWIARIYQSHGERPKHSETFRRILAASLDYIEDPAYEDELAILYYLASESAKVVGDVNQADHLYTMMLENAPDSIKGADDLVTIAKNYYYLVLATYEKGFENEDWVISGKYLGEMKTVVEPRIDELTSVYEIGAVYGYLTDAAMFYLDFGTTDRYQEELKAKLLSMKDDVEDPETKALLYRYLGDVELYFEKPLVAASYYRQMVDYQPTASNINLVAYTYAEASEYECAYKYYKRLLKAKDPGGTYHWMARNAVNSLSRLILCEGESCCP